MHESPTTGFSAPEVKEAEVDELKLTDHDKKGTPQSPKSVVDSCPEANREVLEFRRIIDDLVRAVLPEEFGKISCFKCSWCFFSYL